MPRKRTEDESDIESSTFYMSPGQFKVHEGQEDLLGKGAFGTVYRCYHERHGQVAIKMFDIRGSRSVLEEVFRTVKKEMEMMLFLQKSPQVVEVHGVTKIRIGVPGLVMEYLPRGSLFDLVQKCNAMENGRVPWCLMLRIMHDTASGLAYLHKAKFDERVTHNDLKPENVLLDVNFHAKLCDFGGSNLALHTSCRTRSTTKPRRATTDVHTVYYAAPEYLNNEVEERTRAMDVYSYGMILFYVLKKVPPFCKFESAVVLFKISQGKKPLVNVTDILKREENAQDKDIIEILDVKMRDCWQQDPRKRPHIDSVVDDFHEKLASVGQDTLELAVENLSNAIPVCEESDKNSQVDLDEKYFPEFVPKLEIPFTRSSQDETRPLLASSGTSQHQNKATNSLEFKTWIKEAGNFVANEAPNPVQKDPQMTVKATCSNATIAKKQIVVKNAAEIDISHTEMQLQKGDKVYIKTKSKLAICVIEDDLPYWPAQEDGSTSGVLPKGL